MPYNNAIPQPTDLQSDSQSQILANFAAIQTLIEVNHVTFGASGEGKHKVVVMPVQSPAPTASFAAGDNGFYNFLYPTTNKNEVYVNKIDNSGVVQVPITASILGFTTPSNDSTGWTITPSGIIFIWGTISGTGNLTVNYSSGSGFPVLSKIFSIQLTPVNSGTGDADIAVRLISIDSASQFKVYFSKRTETGSAAGSAKYLIIGM